ncbi:Yip1 family protein [uncultured Gardnerella sp.]|uniref:Yip1 family protein n=1 Tax=uncultured Gardnerella sp. TaxID=293424 RepID=UPI00262DAFBC|nr:Yip1 family protein [uncultured Gardnerella sp.]
MSDVNNSIDDFSSKNQVNNTPENSNYSNEDNNNSFKQQQDSSAYESSMNSDASISFDPKSSSPSSDSSNLHGQSSQYPQAQYPQAQYPQAQYPQAQPQQSQYSQMQFNQQNAQFNQPSQPYAPQNYNQSSQAYNQFNQPQFAQAQAQYAQTQQQYPQAQYNQAQYNQAQYNQAQYPQSQYSQMQFNCQSSYKKPDYSHSMTYNQNSSQYGYRQNAETERLETYYTSTWNKREKILLAIICVVSIGFTYLSNKVLYDTFNSYYLYRHYYHTLPKIMFLFIDNLLWASYSLLPFTLIFSFAIVLRKKYSVILPSICSIATTFLVQAFLDFIIYKNHDFSSYLKFIAYAIVPTVIFAIVLEILQCKFMIRKRSNILSSIILTFVSSFIYVFTHFVFLIILFKSSYDVSDYMYSMISSVILLVVIPVLVSLIMKLLGLPKFLNPQREEMNL